MPEAVARRPQVVVEFDFMRRRSGGKNLIISGYRPLLHHLTQRLESGDLLLMRGSLG